MQNISLHCALILYLVGSFSNDNLIVDTFQLLLILFEIIIIIIIINCYTCIINYYIFCYTVIVLHAHMGISIFYSIVGSILFMFCYNLLFFATVGSPIMLQHGVQYSTGCTCNVSNTSELCLCINEFKQLLLNLHG